VVVVSAALLRMALMKLSMSFVASVLGSSQWLISVISLSNSKLPHSLMQWPSTLILPVPTIMVMVIMFSFVSFDISDKAIALLFCCFWPLFQK
jgi:hypothetical protein